MKPATYWLSAEPSPFPCNHLGRLSLMTISENTPNRVLPDQSLAADWSVLAK